MRQVGDREARCESPGCADPERRPEPASLAVVLLHLGFVFAPVYLAAHLGPSPWVIPLWLWFGLFMPGLLHLMHECAHYSTFGSRRACDLLGRWLLGPLVATDFDAYRRRHWDHHRHLGLAGDTKESYLIDIRGRRLARLVLRCLTLTEAWGREAVRHGARVERGAARAWLGRTALVQAALLGSLAFVAMAGREGDLAGTLIATGTAYAVVYGHGLAALTTLVATLRAIAEHQVGADGAERVGRAALRNFSCGPVTHLLFGVWGFADHATHHREPAVPSYRLRQVTAALAGTGTVPAPRRGYVATLAALARPGLTVDRVPDAAA